MNKKERKELSKKLAEEYNKLGTTEEQLRWILDNKELITLYLDNDSTSVIFTLSPEEQELDEDIYPDLNSLHDWLGNDYGLRELLTILEINWEQV